MKAICAWCNRLLSAEGLQAEEVITHGMCRECEEHLLVGFNHPSLQEFLDRLGMPVLLVDDDVNVLAANDMASKLLGKEKGELEGYRGGDVIECSYARLPGGCGRTVHCNACAIRMSVQDTCTTGKSCEKVPACADLYTENGPTHVQFLISTQKVGQFVLLRIDQVLNPPDGCGLSKEHKDRFHGGTPSTPESSAEQASEL
jgi:hypothetical protein